jgi:hypothetical protein
VGTLRNLYISNLMNLCFVQKIPSLEKYGYYNNTFISLAQLFSINLRRSHHFCETIFLLESSPDFKKCVCSKKNDISSSETSRVPEPDEFSKHFLSFEYEPVDQKALVQRFIRLFPYDLFALSFQPHCVVVDIDTTL